jgi:hypothetical protein
MPKKENEKSKKQRNMFLAWCERSMLIQLFLKVWWCKSTKERKKQRIGGEKKETNE